MLFFLILTDSLLKIYERMSERYERYNSSGECFPDFKNFSQVWTRLSDEWNKQGKNNFQGGGAGTVNIKRTENKRKYSLKNAARTLQCT
ncbi:MAG: hypothetical protein WC799_10980 [Desulfobacteraceae bacterium]|jgi:hypothetical protein